VAVLAALAALLPAVLAAQVATSLTVEDNEAAAPNVISIPGASHSEPFYIVVHEGDAGPGAVVGFSALLPAGAVTDFQITLDRDIVPGELLWPMLHTDGNGNGVYDDAATDPPVFDDDAGNPDINNIVVFSMQVGTAATSLDVEDNEPVSADTISVLGASHGEPFYIAIHEGDADGFAGVVGFTELLPAGSVVDFEVTLDRDIVPGEYLWPMLHTDGDGNGAYDDPATDPPVIDADAGNASFGGVVVFSMQVGTAEEAPAAADTGNAGLTATTAGLGIAGWLALLAGTLVLAGGAGLAVRRS
jgi:hypothetical protein